MSRRAVAAPVPWFAFSRRFWSKVDRTSECWVWTGSRTCGYGHIRVGSRSDGTRTLLRATHVAWELTNGAIPEGLWLLHRCDNPPCVRPTHLFLGTPKDNTDDMAAKGRANTPKGSQRPAARLSEADVLAIREARRQGAVGAELARQYGVHRSTIYHVCQRDYWKHV